MSISSFFGSLFRPNQDTKLSASNSPSSIKIGGDQNTQGFVDWVNKVGTMSDIDYSLETDELLDSMGVDTSNSFLGSLGSIFKKVVSAWDDYTGNTANRENIAYQKEYNQQVFDRADTQFQRTVADLRAAGLSSQLAAGAPSTVAGVSKSPERTVGNESAAIEKLIGMVTSMKQANANANLANAQADKAKAEARAYPELVASQIGSNTAAAYANRASAALNGEYTKLAMIDGETRAAKNLQELQYLITQSRHNNALCRLVENQIDQGKSQIALNDKQLQYLSEQITSEQTKRFNLDAERKLLYQEFNNSALKYMVDLSTYEYARIHDDSPAAAQVSSSQSKEARLKWKREMISDLVGGLSSGIFGVATGVATGIGMGAGMTFGKGAGGKFFEKMFGMDDHNSGFGFHQ